jgi:hypothetical protein
MVEPFTWFEPDLAQLIRILRHVHKNRPEAVGKGRKAAQTTRYLTWQNAANQYTARIHNLCNPR